MINHESTMVYRQGGIMKVYRIEGTKAKEEDQYNNRHIKVLIKSKIRVALLNIIESNRIESIESIEQQAYESANLKIDSIRTLNF